MTPVVSVIQNEAAITAESLSPDTKLILEEISRYLVRNLETAQVSSCQMQLEQSKDHPFIDFCAEQVFAAHGARTHNLR